MAPTTSTVTLSPCPTPDTSCNNAGLQWAYYTALNGNGYPSDSSSFDPTLYEIDAPVINGTTRIISIPLTSDASGSTLFYGKGPEPLASFFVDHRGYFYPPQTGNYTFDYSYVDDAAYLWVGDLAYSGWNNTNYNEYGSWGTAAPSVQIFLTKDEYVPIRLAYGQGGGAGGLTVDIYAPDGETVISSTSDTASPYFVAFSCDGTAPKYPAWGAE